MILALAALLLLLVVICDPAWREIICGPPSPFLAFIQAHTLCQGQREFGATSGGVHWAACPCGAYLEDRPFVPQTWPERLLFNLGRWYHGLTFTLGRWGKRLEATLWVPVIQAARRISAWRRIALGWLRRQLALLGAR